MQSEKDIHADAIAVTKKHLSQGLPAHVRSDCRVLLLGSMPGVASLEAARYYAHPRNRFWPLMHALLGIDAAASYALRLQALLDHRVGLWDVIGQCERRGSLDTSIVAASIVVNPLPALLATLPQLRMVACNGAAAAQAWRRHVQPRLSAQLCALPVVALPSTSPANAAWSLPRLAAAWQPLCDALR
ncbi:DNA-deoxyinosine glycosylase [Xanthomonas perforans]|uniref:DNA glycosylase n=8 Tax=Xanthomonas TaxID=338 RepID=A0A0G8UH77_XANPE|nr:MULTISPECIES: DNA-deoxyinosine glycosylase [Xanthomonas]WVK03472.1 DNA-deoxyinosine glycosylase [Xanthomonas campestris pv. olitorii]AOY67123.1 DNA-deoxyinosine glycosylase [Xanthomonas euvesicatoria pv. vesicatoria str. 85-10]APO89289.1 DNA-deoxyinosine glycosylase [Xanthomonas euvesicatoria]APP01225.1 DNA-deoxyinosine glycosylase [Xanthomonas perforans]AQS77635.1 DNA-deoxyinosine glycosylase [Xanthomonas perforans 91-118]